MTKYRSITKEELDKMDGEFITWMKRNYGKQVYLECSKDNWGLREMEEAWDEAYERQQKEINRLKEALEFYADYENYGRE